MALDPDKTVLRFEIEVIETEIVPMTHEEYLEYLSSLDENDNNQTGETGG